MICSLGNAYRKAPPRLNLAEAAEKGRKAWPRPDEPLRTKERRRESKYGVSSTDSTHENSTRDNPILLGRVPQLFTVY